MTFTMNPFQISNGFSKSSFSYICENFFEESGMGGSYAVLILRFKLEKDLLPSFSPSFQKGVVINILPAKITQYKSIVCALFKSKSFFSSSLAV